MNAWRGTRRLPHLQRVMCLALTAWLVSGCTGVFLHPDRVHYLPDRALGTPAEDVWIAAPDGSALHALHLPASQAPRGALLFLHGNAENLSSHVHAVSWLPAQGYAVLALDYRGFGRSQGRASVDALHEDAQAALDWLATRHDANVPLLLYGQSLGGSVAIRLGAHNAHRARLAAVIADSAFSSYRGIAREKLGQVWLTWLLQWPLALLISDRHAALDVAAQVSPVPLLLIHGERDPIVDVRHAQRLFDAAHEPKVLWRVAEGGHIDAVRRPAVRTRLIEYLEAVTASAPRP